MKLVTAQLERLVEKICCGLIVAPFKRLKGIFQVQRCAFNECTGVNPNFVAQKLFNHFNYTTADFGSIRKAVHDGGVGPKLFWLHKEGYFEDFLGLKSGLD